MKLGSQSRVILLLHGLSDRPDRGGSGQISHFEIVSRDVFAEHWQDGLVSVATEGLEQKAQTNVVLFGYFFLGRQVVCVSLGMGNNTGEYRRFVGQLHQGPASIHVHFGTSVFKKFDEFRTTGAILEFDGQDDRLLDPLPSLRGKILADAIIDKRPEVFACEF